MKFEINVYIANLGAYNSGELIGEWISLPLEVEELQAKMNKILLATDEDGYLYGEEYAIHDYEAPFNIHEYANIFKLNEKAAMIDSLTEYEQGSVEMILEAKHCNDIEDAIELVRNGEIIIYNECYCMADVAYTWIHDHIGSIKDAVSNPEYYIDTETIIRDMDINGEFEDDMDEEEKEAYVEELIEEGIFKNNENYFDYEAFGRDMEIEGTFYYIGNGVYIEIME